MYDFHLHSRVSFDGKASAAQIVEAAKSAGLGEICFTDHVDYDPKAAVQTMVFDPAAYSSAYDSLGDTELAIRLGMEFGMTPDNAPRLRELLTQRRYDFILGSVHFVEGIDVYFPEYWEGKTVFQAQRQFLEQTLACVRAHEDFDVLAHLTFLSKSPANPERIPIAYDDHRTVLDEILKELVRKGKGMEMNTSGVDRQVGFLPGREYFVRFRELGGRIVTVGSDAHTADRVGQYCGAACGILKDIFGYVCTFQGRNPVFHRL